MNVLLLLFIIFFAFIFSFSFYDYFIISFLVEDDAIIIDYERFLFISYNLEEKFVVSRNKGFFYLLVGFD